MIETIDMDIVAVEESKMTSMLEVLDHAVAHAEQKLAHPALLGRRGRAGIHARFGRRLARLAVRIVAAAARAAAAVALRGCHRKLSRGSVVFDSVQAARARGGVASHAQTGAQLRARLGRNALVRIQHVGSRGHDSCVVSLQTRPSLVARRGRGWTTEARDKRSRNTGAARVRLRAANADAPLTSSIGCTITAYTLSGLGRLQSRGHQRCRAVALAARVGEKAEELVAFVAPFGCRARHRRIGSGIHAARGSPDVVA